jgi:hypothetical protein
MGAHCISLTPKVLQLRSNTGVNKNCRNAVPEFAAESIHELGRQRVSSRGVLQNHISSQKCVNIAQFLEAGSAH